MARSTDDGRTAHLHATSRPMKHIEIPYAEPINKSAELEKVAKFLAALQSVPIDTQSWPQYNYKPQCRFSMAHSGDCIFIKFDVGEKFARAVYRHNNDPVSKDSCVEFFIALDGGDSYYNFEFNCVGTCKAGFGPKIRQDRDCLSDDIIDRINRRSLIQTGNQHHSGLVTWELTVAIPLEVFCYSDVQSLNGLKGRANFYKCGDDLPEPHFVAWNEVKAPLPDFHQPEFFGGIHFL